MEIFKIKIKNSISIEMLSITTIWQLLFTIPFTIIALHSIKEYLKDREDSKKKHVCYAFSSFSIGFVLNLVGVLMIPFNMGPGERLLVCFLSRLFDIFNVIGLLWVFVFLADFIEGMKKYLPFVFIHMAITVIIIISTKTSIVIVGHEIVTGRPDIRALAIIVFWFFYWGIVALKFWKFSRLTANKVVMRRCQMMSVGAVFAISAYLAKILSVAYQNLILHFSGEIFAAAAGVVFYIGFVVPEWMRRRWRNKFK